MQTINQQLLTNFCKIQKWEKLWWVKAVEQQRMDDLYWRGPAWTTPSVPSCTSFAKSRSCKYVLGLGTKTCAFGTENKRPSKAKRDYCDAVNVPIVNLSWNQIYLTSTYCRGGVVNCLCSYFFTFLEIPALEYCVAPLFFERCLFTLFTVNRIICYRNMMLRVSSIFL